METGPTIPTIGGKPIYTVATHPREAITKSDRLSYHSNAVLLQNAGNTTVTINNSWTLKPGQPLAIGAELPAIVKGSLHIRFLNDPPAGETANNLLEWMESYIEHPIIFKLQKG